MQKSSDIKCVTIVSGRTGNMDRMLTKIHQSIAKEKRRNVRWEHLPSIDYLENLSHRDTTESIKKEILTFYKSEENIWWIHNYHLGKNPYFTKALLEISSHEKQKMVFHIHDFPECSRYSLLNRLRINIKEDLYPLNDNVHYAVINKRDYNFLVNAGIYEEMISLLENPISTVNFTTVIQKETYQALSGKISVPFSAWKKEEPYMLYPVRSIRRKNIAEAALTAVLSDKNLIITLPGESVAEKKYSLKCRDIFKRGLSPGMFGIGFAIEDYGISFEQLISSSSMIISTSVQEGFGYLFLNSMNWGKPLFARDLDILEDFKESFINYPACFYNQFKIPLTTQEKSSMVTLYNKKIESPSMKVKQTTKNKLKTTINKIFSEEYPDYSYLSLNLQIKILEELKTNDEFLKKCRTINKKMIQKINIFFDTKTAPNHKTLQKKWSFDSYCKKTEKILMDLDKSSANREQKKPDKTISETMEDYFTSPEYFRLLYDE